MTKKCSKCGETKPLTEFHKSGYPRKDGSQSAHSYCKECSRKHFRAAQLQARYGITEAQYSVLLQAQQYRCAVCGATEKEAKTQQYKYNPFVVDHDHSTGRVRGLLCHRCNTMLGLSLDSPAVLERGAAYLRRQHGN